MAVFFIASFRWGHIAGNHVGFTIPTTLRVPGVPDRLNMELAVR